MYFKRIDICGFKSFAEPVSIDLSKGITCIVGPNGSGKSNVSDAIRWVLGEQSPKVLRGGKMEDVIFSGTAKRRSKGMAEVVLVIDNTSKILPIDYSEVAITRRAFRSGEGEYYINSNQCRLKDIRELIMDTGIGVDGYSLIGQGKIADIVSNKVESRREIFEEAAGIVKYRSKKAEAEKKLENTAVNLSRVNDIIAEISGRIESLKSESDIAKEYLKLNDEYKKVEVNVILKNIEDIELKNEYLKDDLVDLNVKLEEITERQATIKEEIAQGQEEQLQLEALLEEARTKKIQLLEEINSMNSDDIVRKEKLNLFEEQEARLKQEMVQLHEKLLQSNAKVEEFDEEINLIEDEITICQDQIEKKQAELEKFVSHTETLTQAIENKKERLFELHSNLAETKAESTGLQNLVETLEKKKNQLAEEEKEYEAIKKDKEEQLQELRTAIEQKSEDKKAIEKEVEKQKNEVNSIAITLKKIADELQKNKYDFANLSGRKRTIEELESNYDGYSYAVKYVMKRDFAGVHGVLADLIKVPQGFELAIETALGAALQNIVCSDEQVARNIIETLKREKAGRLTFLPLSSMRGEVSGISSEISSSSGFKGIACNCIEFDEKYKGIVQYLLGKVVIVDNLQNAIAITKKGRVNFRIVTLEGDVINTGGAITGGAYKNKTANIFERKAEIAELSDKLELLEEKNKKLQEENDIASQKQTETLYNLEELEKKLKVVQLKHFEIQNLFKQKSDELQTLNAAAQKRQTELKAIFEEEKSTKGVFEELIFKNEAISEQIEELKRELESDMAVLQESKGPEKEGVEKLAEMKVKFSEIQNRKNTKEFQAGEIKKQIKQFEESIERAKNDLQKVKSDIEELNSQSQDYRKLQEKQKEREVLEGYINEISEKRSQLFELGKNKTRAADELAEQKNSKYGLEIKLAKSESALENFKNKLWDEFEISYIQASSFRSEEINFADAQKQARILKSQIKELGSVNIGAIKEYEEVERRYEFLQNQKSDIQKAMQALRTIIEDMDTTIKVRFKESFDAIAQNFEIVFKELFGGGSAMLEMDNPQNPLESAIEIIAQPPGKKLQNINLLSGGEKTMTAIALMFAVLKAKPTPFCILDEVEAALDDGNVEKFAEYLRKFEKIQFALITHQKVTMEHADVLYGITMPEQGVSKLLSLKLEKAV
ncbi:MAG: chromosome segregation protein SMC [Clostridiales bacterium]|nr:chromosome segregation protein SMC [Clostridiales bacterium]